MIASEVRAGTSFVVYSDFIDEYGDPIVLDQAAGYSVRDENNKLIISGIGEQGSKAERWQSSISIPAEVPAGNYAIVWAGTSKKGKIINRETFRVVDDSPNFYELDALVPERSIVTDSLKVERNDDVQDVIVSIVDVQGNRLFSSTESGLNERISGNDKFIMFNSATPIANLEAGNGAFAMYIIDWQFTLNGEPAREHHFMYVTNYKIIGYVRELNRMINQARIQNSNPNLNYNQVDLVAFLNMGLQRINAEPPTQTSYSLATAPDTLYTFILAAAAIEAMSSRYIAEGEAAFNFNGQPITLEVDRTQFLDTAIQRLETKLEKLSPVKRGIVMTTGGGGYGSASGLGGGNPMGVLGLSVGPTLEFSPFGFNSRSPLYYSVLSNLGYTDPY